MFYTPLLTAQILYNETFENFTVGNLGTDPTGVIPGQYGWFTKIGSTGGNKNNHAVITNEIGRGKVLTLLTGTQPPEMYARLKKEGLNTFIDQRKAGYNVIKFEFDFFTGPLNTSLETRMFHEISLGYNLENYVGILP